LSVFISAGEPSGDHYMAQVAQSLEKGGYSGGIWGLGGRESRDLGIECKWNNSRLQIIGLAEVIPAIPYALKLIKEVSGEIIRREPEAVALIDCPEFHMRLAAKLRRKGYKGRLIYIAPPSIWAWRKGRADKIRELFDVSLPLFEFEHKALIEKGCASYWKGHPLLEEYVAMNSGEDIAGSLGDGRTVAFFPGSRGGEIKRLLPIMDGAAAMLKERGLRPLFSVAPGLTHHVRDFIISFLVDRGYEFYEGAGRDVYALAACAVAASGTVTLEALLAGCYTVVTYKLSPITEFVARRIIKLDRLKLFALPNIVAGKEVFPELITENANSESAAKRVFEWLDADEEFKADKLKEIRDARRALGERGVYDFWADRIARCAD
jgi:lipid-A-disaccharide synthase